MNIGAKIKRLRKEAGLTQTELGEKLGVKTNAVSKWECGRVEDIPTSKIKALAALFDISVADLIDDTSQEPTHTFPSLPEDALQVARDYTTLDGYGKQAVRDLIGNEQRRCEDETRFLAGAALQPDPIVINLYSEPAAAGVAVPTMGKDYTLYELAPGDPKGAAYAVRVQGDSMEPAFHDGDIAFVNHDALRNGDIGVFCVDGGTVIKQYYHDPLGMTYLFSLNRKRSDADVLIYPSSGQTVVCQGRVITPRRYPLPTRG